MGRGHSDQCHQRRRLERSQILGMPPRQEDASPRWETLVVFFLFSLFFCCWFLVFSGLVFRSSSWENSPGMGAWSRQWCRGGGKKKLEKSSGKVNFRILCTGVATGMRKIPHGNILEDEGAVGIRLEGTPGALPDGFWGISVGIFPRGVSEWERKEPAVKRVRSC